ncbi:MAG TPA: ROK family protein, partial [Actinomycetota bacterium]|nr:ROK family protein [Actinomycetota bacterium]
MGAAEGAGLPVLAVTLPQFTGDLLLTPARASFERYVHARAHRDLPPVVPARLGADAGLVG